MEIWKDIQGYEGLYQVSNLGRIKSLDRYVVRHRKGTTFKALIKGKFPSISLTKDGYEKVTLCNKEKTITFRVHRLVAETFIPNPLNLPHVNHKDENKRNNHVENLEFCSIKYNCNYGNRNKKISSSRINDPSLSYKIYQYTLDKKLIKIWPSLCECERNGFHRCNIARVCNGEYKQHKGYIWSYTKLD